MMLVFGSSFLFVDSIQFYYKNLKRFPANLPEFDIYR